MDDLPRRLDSRSESRDLLAQPRLSAIRLARMTVARDMIKQLGLDIYAEGLNKMISCRSTAWVRYDLPARDNPFQFTLQKVYGDPCLQDVDALENIGKNLFDRSCKKLGTT